MSSTAAYCVRLVRWCLLLSISLLPTLLFSCDPEDEPKKSSSSSDKNAETHIGLQAVVIETDSDEWAVQVFREHVVYADAINVAMPEPWVFPTKEDATLLKGCVLTWGVTERFVTSDGYTFGMPSANVSKAGQKTKYSVVGLYKRRTVLVIDFTPTNQ